MVTKTEQTLGVLDTIISFIGVIITPLLLVFFAVMDTEVNTATLVFFGGFWVVSNIRVTNLHNRNG